MGPFLPFLPPSANVSAGSSEFLYLEEADRGVVPVNSKGGVQGCVGFCKFRVQGSRLFKCLGCMGVRVVWVFRFGQVFGCVAGPRGHSPSARTCSRTWTFLSRFQIKARICLCSDCSPQKPGSTCSLEMLSSVCAKLGL